MSQTKAHELLGQSVLFAPVKALFNRIGKALIEWAQADEQQCSFTTTYNLARATG